MEKTMFKQNTLKVLVASSLVAGAVSVVAQESVTSTASVIVSNAFDFVETQPITFGTVTAIGYTNSSSGVAGDIRAFVTVPADGSAPSASATTGTSDTDPDDNDASITLLSAGARGLYDISNAAPFTDLTVTLPTSVAVSAPSAPPSNGQFIMDTFTAVDTSDSSVVASGGTIQTDGTGAAQLGLGARLITPAVAAAPSSLSYIDATYNGTYTITVSY
jgi:hypothetical protein